MGGIVRLAQILYLLRLADRVILTSHMVGHKVDDDFQTSLMGARYQGLELLHALFDIDSQVGVNVIIVGNGIG